MSARLIGRTGATAGQDFALMDLATIGAAPDSEIRIVAPGVSRRHARIVADKGQYFLEDAGATNGTFLNGGRVQREALRHLDVITLGRAVDLIFIKRDNETPAPLPDKITSARVRIADGPEAGTVVEVPKGELTFGRAPSCSVVLTSGLISKVHARLQRTANQLVLQDLQSINGTFVNAARIDSVVVLRNGDVINFAGVRNVSVTIEGAAAAAAAQAPVPAAIAEAPAFNQEWKTRFVWAPDELELIEAARAEAMQLAALRAPAAGAAADKKAAAPVKPPAAAPAAAKPEVAPKPAPPAAPKAEGAEAKPAAPVAPKPAAPVAPKPVAPVQPAKADEPPPTMPIKRGDVRPAAENTVPIGATKASRIRGIKLVGPGIPIALGLGTFIVGRAVGSDVQLDDRQVSRSHARITVDETSAMVEDLQTVNGTLLNGKEVKARQPLRPGDTVQFGGSEFKVELTTT